MKSDRGDRWTRSPLSPVTRSDGTGTSTAEVSDERFRAFGILYFVVGKVNSGPERDSGQRIVIVFRRV